LVKRDLQFSIDYIEIILTLPRTSCFHNNTSDL